MSSKPRSIREDWSPPESGHSDPQVAGTIEQVHTIGSSVGDDLLDLLGDEYTRRILRALSVADRPARELVTRCEMSRPTVYRRLNRLAEHGLVTASTALDHGGHHRKVFTSTLEEFSLDLESEEPAVRLVLREPPQGHSRSPRPAI